jgi:hypothetical protein
MLIRNKFNISNGKLQTTKKYLIEIVDELLIVKLPIDALHDNDDTKQKKNELLEKIKYENWDYLYSAAPTKLTRHEQKQEEAFNLTFIDEKNVFDEEEKLESPDWDIRCDENKEIIYIYT